MNRWGRIIIKQTGWLDIEIWEGVCVRERECVLMINSTNYGVNSFFSRCVRGWKGKILKKKKRKKLACFWRSYEKQEKKQCVDDNMENEGEDERCEINKPDRRFHLMNAKWKKWTNSRRRRKTKREKFVWRIYLWSMGEVDFVFYLFFHLLLILSKSRREKRKRNVSIVVNGKVFVELLQELPMFSIDHRHLTKEIVVDSVVVVVVVEDMESICLPFHS